LMGPVFGVIIGIILGMCSLIWDLPLARQASFLFIALNVSNLLPLLPFDGGHVVYGVIFCRSMVADVAFKGVAVAALIGAGLLRHCTFLPVVGALLLLSLPMSLRIAKVVRDLRLEGVVEASPDDQTIPLPVAERIIDKLKAASTRLVQNRLLAQQTLQV